MNPTRFAAGHAAHADWHVALARALDALLLELRAAGGHDHTRRDGLPEYTLGFCYLSDPFAADADEIVAELQRRLPGVHWVGTVGIGVAATGAEHFDEPEELQRRIGCFANARVVTVPDCGHNLQHDQPEAVAAALEDFLDRETP